MISLKPPYLWCNSIFAIIPAHFRQILVDESAVILTKNLTKLALEVSESFPESALPNLGVKLALNEEFKIPYHQVIYRVPKAAPARAFLTGDKNTLRS